jgi:hypothetical protein
LCISGESADRVDTVAYAFCQSNNRTSVKYKPISM